GAREQGAHRRIERPVGAADAVALLLQKAGERSHPRTADRHAVDVELWRRHGPGFSFAGRECSISGAFIHLVRRSRQDMERQIKTAILAFCAVLLVVAPALAAGAPKAVAVDPIKDVGTTAKG